MHAVFLDAAAEYGLSFDEGDVQRLGRYLDLLLEANRSFNLTGIRDLDEAWMKHAFDSLTLLPWLQEAAASTVIDVGSGGGLPGMPLAITLPDVSFVLLEATGKKAAFLRETVVALGLANVEVLHARAEDAGNDREHHREHYDAVVTRAVGPLNVLLELTVPLARIEGHVFAIKGEKAPQEVEAAGKALHQLHAAVVSTTRTPTGTIVAIQKRRSTPKMYPRRSGEPKRSPLGGRLAGPASGNDG